MKWFKELFFSNKETTESELSGYQTSIISDSVKPPDCTIEAILNESFEGMIARQWVNWSAEQIGEEKKYYLGYPLTVKSLWVLYEGCRVYKEKNVERKSNSLA